MQTATCNGCHGATTDTQLALHGGGRTQVEYCVTCHNPFTTDATAGNVVDFKVMIHKIHDGANLANGYTICGFGSAPIDYSHVNFTKDIDDCTVCHQGGGADVNNWYTVPTMEACGSCHDDVNFATGANHGTGGVQTSDQNCAFCHPPSGDPTRRRAGCPSRSRSCTSARAARRRDLHRRHQRLQDRERELLEYEPAADDRLLGHPQRREDGARVAPEWTAPGGASRLAVIVGWNTEPTTRTATSGSNPAQPISVNALDVGGVVTALGGGVYRVVTLPSSATRPASRRAGGPSRGRPRRRRHLLRPHRGQERLPLFAVARAGRW